MLNLAQLEIELYQRRYEDRIEYYSDRVEIFHQSWLTSVSHIMIILAVSENNYAKDPVIVLTVKHNYM